MGAQVLKAWNGKEAVDLFAASAPGEIELIMMDIMMPVMNEHLSKPLDSDTIRAAILRNLK